MNIDDLTIKQARELTSLFGTHQATGPTSPHIGKKCIIRSYASGVHFGTLVSQDGRQIELSNARRLWSWDVSPHGISLSEVAIYGPVGPRSKICCAVAAISILDGIEVIPCTDESARVIEEAKAYTP